jgi:hypothetical protein
MAECVYLHGKFDYLVVDEAHKFYYDTNSMNIIADKYVSGNHLLLTGSPAIFKEKVISGEISAKYISASLIESTKGGQYDKEIRLDVVSNDIHLTIDDYNNDGEVIKNSQSKLTNNDAILESLLVGNFGKTIIYVKRTKQADEIQRYLNNRGIDNLISHSKTDKDSLNIKKFKEEYSGVDDVVLIVVDRATEGYDDPNVSIIDLTYTKMAETFKRLNVSVPNYELEIEYGTKSTSNKKALQIIMKETQTLLKIIQQSNYIITGSMSEKIISYYKNVRHCSSLSILW